MGLDGSVIVEVGAVVMTFDGKISVKETRITDVRRQKTEGKKNQKNAAKHRSPVLEPHLSEKIAHERQTSGFSFMLINKKATCVVLFVFVWSSSSAIDVA